MAIFALCLPLAHANPYYVAYGIPVYVFVVACLARGDKLKRALVWGPLLGTLLFGMAGIIVSTLCGERMLPMFEPRPIAKWSGQYAVPIGGFVGGVVGLLIAAAVGPPPPKDGE